MNPLSTALWFVEMYLSRQFELSAVAETCNISPEHLTRSFGQAFGMPLMTYARKRRLSEAALKLVHNEQSILSIALDVGYGSSEAFAHAFRSEFATNPHNLRTTGSLAGLNLTEPIKMNEQSLPDLEAPRLAKRPAFRVAGLKKRFTYDQRVGIPNLWEQFIPHLGEIDGQIGSATFGLCANFDDEAFDYYAAAEIDQASETGSELVTFEVPAQTYLVFTHKGHVSNIAASMSAAIGKGIPEAGKSQANGPSFELYGDRFNPITGIGEIELWLPVED
ncbi:MAG: GyrI-like domain-containing protein [Hyphomicrobiaceae bacterium]|nr:GyrI-like domain-containing protein [Hyphomicrobiaceae bacterium]MCC0024154.1 GyrI-like domain-containing protein [Hyphomicrobiaceae bacterium]